MHAPIWLEFGTPIEGVNANSRIDFWANSYK